MSAMIFSAASGTVTAPFSGIHGWYWENPGTQTTTVTLSAAGCYKMALSSNLKREAAHRFYDSLGFGRHGYSFLIEP